MTKKELPTGEKLVYYALNILTLGTSFFLKVIIKKALIESK